MTVSVKESPSDDEDKQGCYISDKGFAGDQPHQRWREQFDAEVITPPHQRSKRKWSKEWRRWLAHLRQGIKGVFDKLLNTFRLVKERLHTLNGGFKLAWQPGSACTIFTFGVMYLCNGLLWLLLT